MSKDKILSSRQGDVAQLRVVGRGSILTSGGADSYCQECANSGVSRVLVDLSQCSGMDSTFVGTMLALREESAGKDCDLVFVNVSPQVRAALDQMGVSHVFELSDEKIPEGNFSVLCDAAKAGRLDVDRLITITLALIKANPRLEEAFRPLLEQLQAEKTRAGKACAS